MKSHLVLFCSGGCKKAISAPIPIYLDPLTQYLRQHGWFLSVLTPPNQGPDVPIEMGATCGDCTRRLMPEAAKVAEEVLKKTS